MAYGRRAIYRKRNGRTRKTTLRRTPYKRTPPWKRTAGGFKAQGGTSIPRGVFPISVMKKLRYVDDITITPATTQDTYVFRANSVFDPDNSVGGHQPRGFDQMAAFYNHYTVVGSKITVKYIPTVTKATNSEPFYLWVVTSTNTNPMSTEATNQGSTFLESAMVKRAVVVRGGDESNTIRNPTVTSTFSAKKFFRCKSIVGNTPYRAAISGNPTEEAYFTIYGQSIDGTTVPAYQLQVMIDYMVVFSEPISIADS